VEFISLKNPRIVPWDLAPYHRKAVAGIPARGTAGNGGLVAAVRGTGGALVTNPDPSLPLVAGRSGFLAGPE